MSEQISKYAHPADELFCGVNAVFEHALAPLLTGDGDLIVADAAVQDWVNSGQSRLT